MELTRLNQLFNQISACFFDMVFDPFLLSWVTILFSNIPLLQYAVGV